MTSRFVAVCFKASAPDRLADFWGSLLGWPRATDFREHVALLPSDDTGFELRFHPTDELKRAKNGKHFDLTTNSLDEQQEVVAKVLELGGRHIDVGQLPEERHVVLADPEGNELCVLPPHNAFLADCGFLGAVACDGSEQVGYFWSKALDWPLVWDQDGETAVRSPHGGPKVTWGDPPPLPRDAPDRLYFQITPPAPGNLDAEIARLVSPGAQLTHDERPTTASVYLADPDGHEFWVTDAS